MRSHNFVLLTFNLRLKNVVLLGMVTGCTKQRNRQQGTTDNPVALIGEQSGIPSRATLARLFRNTYGMSCSEYRQVAGQK